MIRSNITINICLIFIFISCAHQQVKSPGKKMIRVNSFLASTGKFNLILKKARDCYDSPTRVLNSTIDSLHKKVLKEKKVQRDFKTYHSLGLCYLVREDFLKADFYFKIALDLAESQQEKSAVYNNLGILFAKNNHLISQLFFKKSISERRGFENSFNASLLNSYYNIWDSELIGVVEKSPIKGEAKNILLGNYYFYNRNYSRGYSYYKRLKQRKIIENKIGENYLWSLIKLNRIKDASVYYDKYKAKLSVDRVEIKEILKNGKFKPR